ncbi:alpha/beta hydrolase [Rhodococcus sp. NPDC058521]|uniref:alpha/beta hydrolase n=1 Tax=Rhodococcus sp. NPDC058521 TaxID=3346536 RepID=UPI0036651329
MRSHDSVVWHWNVSLRARAIFRFVRLLVKPLFTLWPLTDKGIELLAWLDRIVGRLPVPKGLDVEKFTLGGVPSERITHTHVADGSLAGATVLYLHGGGFVFCGLATHRPMCGLLAAQTGVPVVSVAYRQLPEGPIGVSLSDALSAYEELLETCEDPAKIIVAGDSAGGYLAMKVAEIAALTDLTPPAAVIGFSPLLNLDMEDHDPDFMKLDAYLPMSQVAKLKDRWLEGSDSIVGAQSPVRADPKLFPPVFFSAAEYEIMRPDVEITTENFDRVGQPIETHIWSGQIHAFPVIGKSLRESREIIRAAVAFAERSLATQVRRSA